jgi:hypothetical protein
MLNDTTQIIGDVPGKHLDPLLVARSQAHNSLGFIMISYEQKPAIADTPIERYYDLLFFRGPEIYECARMNRDLRFQIRPELAFQTFSRMRRDDQARISLYTASDQVLSRFQSTLLYEPCLKVQIEGLSKKQIATLLRTTTCHKGIIESNQFINPTPSIDLREINSLDDVLQYQPPFKRGRILVYDIEKNKELIEERHASQSKRSTFSASDIRDAHDDQSTGSNRTAIQFSNTSEDSVTEEVISPVDEQESEEFTSFIKQILNSPSSTETKTCLCPPLKRRDSEPKSRETKPTRRLTRPHSEKTSPEPQPKNQKPESSEYIKLMERIFRSFHQQLLNSFGDKCDAVISDAVSKVRLLTPDFDLQRLDERTAVMTLDTIEHIAANAPFLKRSRLRQAALTLVADLYNKQYDLLEIHRVIDEVEQCYYRLKK